MKRFQTLAVMGFFILIAAWIIYIIGVAYYMQKPQKKLRPVVVLSLDSSMYEYAKTYQYDMQYLDKRGDTCEAMFADRKDIDSIINGTLDPTRPR